MDIYTGTPRLPDTLWKLCVSHLMPLPPVLQLDSRAASIHRLPIWLHWDLSPPALTPCQLPCLPGAQDEGGGGVGWVSVASGWLPLPHHSQPPA